MSGNRGSGKSSGDQSGNSLSANTCSTLAFETPLYSPVPAVVTRLKKGEFLRVELDSKLRTVLAITQTGDVAGTIVGSKMSSIASCLKNGFVYKGEIIRLSGGNCTINITIS